MRILKKMKDMANVLFVFLKKLNENKVLVYASSAAYYFFVSIIPLLMILYFMLSYTSVGIEDLASMINSVLPDGVNIFAETLMAEMSGHLGAHMSFAVVLIIWSASRGVVAISNGLNIIYDVKRKQDGKHFALFQLKSIFYTLIFIVLVIAWLLIMTISKDMVGVVSHWLPRVGSFMEFWMKKRHLVSFVTMTISFFLMYLLLPEKRKAAVDEDGGVALIVLARLIGAAVASFLWTLFAILFSWWVHSYASFTIYGSLAAIVLSLYWIYLGMVIIMIGAQISRFCRHLLLWFKGHSDISSFRTAFSVMGTQYKYKGMMRSGISFIGRVCVLGKEIENKDWESSNEKIVLIAQKIEMNKLPENIFEHISAIAAESCDNELRLIETAKKHGVLVFLGCEFEDKALENINAMECVVDGDNGNIFINPYPWTRL